MISASKEELLSEIQEYIGRMPSLSTTVTKVMEVCNQPNTSPNDLNRVISLDPVLTGQVLKLINSAYYSLPNQVTTLTRAIIMLGLNTVKNLAISTAVLDAIGKEGSQCFPMDSFWTHSLCVGVTAKALAASKKIPAAVQEEYFVSGLLHDIGKIPFSNCFPGEYKNAIELADLQRGSLLRAEEMIFGFDHHQTGKMIAEKWQLSKNINLCLSHHHNPQDITQEHKDLVNTVAAANLFANIFEFGSAGDRFQEIPDVVQTLDITEMSWNTMGDLFHTVEEEIEKAQVFLNVSKQ
ncbi:MAG: HDOD domain-containing protein [Desulfobulbaceae bacterium]|uniref:HDOD domain-containing protein n=1 Tax=Candidatus Desulfobia pelagia TaxID=2841692 RepID=A0A8J6TG50_9BACT|nr:HDOD domain-containing protein [Candidatus Desulfobia pelagia]